MDCIPYDSGRYTDMIELYMNELLKNADICVLWSGHLRPCKLLYLFQLLSLFSMALSYHILITHFSLKKIIKEILNTCTSLSYNTPRRKKKMTLIVIGILALCAIPAVYTIKNYMNEN